MRDLPDSIEEIERWEEEYLEKNSVLIRGRELLEYARKYPTAYAMRQALPENPSLHQLLQVVLAEGVDRGWLDPSVLEDA